MKFSLSNSIFPRLQRCQSPAAFLKIGNRKSEIENHRAFSLIEILVVVSLLSLIVLALMAVFSSTQRAFRASVTQTEVMEGSRETMELMASDLRATTPSGGVSNGPVNFSALANANYLPLTNSLPGSASIRFNVLNYFFVLGRNNTTWTGTGYVVDPTSANPLYPLYRFYAETNIQNSPATLYGQFYNEMQTPQWWTNSNFSHLIDGVAHLTVHAYDPNGNWINAPAYTNAVNTEYFSDAYGEPQFFMFSNTVPAAVELELGVLEDRTLARAESLPFQSPAQLGYLGGQSGTVHLFRQRVTIPNVDPTAYLP
jgi:type II secretory pathway component PulJ